MRHHAQLDLRIIGRKQDLALLRDKSGPNLPAKLGANRNVLQIGVARAEPASSRAGLRKTRVQPPSLRVNQLRQRVNVGGFELGDFAEFDDLRR